MSEPMISEQWQNWQAKTILAIDPADFPGRNSSIEEEAAALKTAVEARGGRLHIGEIPESGDLGDGINMADLDPDDWVCVYMPEIGDDEAQQVPVWNRTGGIITAATKVDEQAIQDMAAYGGGAVSNQRLGAGTNNWPKELMAELGVPLSNIPKGNSDVVKNHIVNAALRYSGLIDFETMDRQIAAGEFDTLRDLKDYPVENIRGKKVAILGVTGNIGQATAEALVKLGFDVTGWSDSLRPRAAETMGITAAASPEECCKDADIIITQTGLMPGQYVPGQRGGTEGIVSRECIENAHDGCLFINADRKGVEDMDAVRDALRSGKIGVALVDVDAFPDRGDDNPARDYLEERTASLSDPGYKGRIIITGHSFADSDRATRTRLYERALDQTLLAWGMHPDYKDHHVIVNGVGPIPQGYEDGSRMRDLDHIATPDDAVGFGKVSAHHIVGMVQDETRGAKLEQYAETALAIIRDIRQGQLPANEYQVAEQVEELQHAVAMLGRPIGTQPIAFPRQTQIAA